MQITFGKNDDKIRFQLKDLETDRLLFDFWIYNEDYYSLMNHMDDKTKEFEEKNQKRIRLSKRKP